MSSPGGVRPLGALGSMTTVSKALINKVNKRTGESNFYHSFDVLDIVFSRGGGDEDGGHGGVVV